MGSFRQKETRSDITYYVSKPKTNTLSIIMRAGINIVNRTLTPRQRSTFISFKPGQLADTTDQSRCELSIPFQRLGRNHWLDRLEVD